MLICKIVKTSIKSKRFWFFINIYIYIIIEFKKKRKKKKREHSNQKKSHQVFCKILNQIILKKETNYK